MNFRYFNLRLVQQKWTRIVTHNFARNANHNRLLFGVGVKVHFPLEGPLFDISETVHFLKSSHFENKDVPSANILQID